MPSSMKERNTARTPAKALLVIGEDREAAERLAAQCGELDLFEAVHSTTPAQAARRLAQYRPDAVLVDLQPSRIDRCLAVLRRIRAAAPAASAPAMFVLSPDISPPRVGALLEAGADTVMRDPADGAELALRLVNGLAIHERQRRLARRADTLEAELAVRTAALEQARAEADAARHARSAFLPLLSHELKTPLSIIHGYVELLLTGNRGRLSAAQRKDLETILSQAQGLNARLSEILEFAALSAQVAEVRSYEIDLGALVRDTAARTEFPAGVRLRLRTPRHPLVGMTDPDRLQSALSQLLSNAAKFTTGGEVVVQLDATDERVRLQVRDSGIGIRGVDLKRICEPFWQHEDPLRRNTTGIGLGLAIARRQVEVLGGELSVRSSRRAGTCFTLSLPRRSERQPDCDRAA